MYSQLFQIPSTPTILLIPLVVIVAFILSYMSIAISLSVSFQSESLRAQVANWLSRLATFISGVVSFPQVTTLISEFISVRSEIITFRSELASLISEIADLQTKCQDLCDRHKSLEREFARFRDTKSSISVQEVECTRTNNCQDREPPVVEQEVLTSVESKKQSSSVPSVPPPA